MENIKNILDSVSSRLGQIRTESCKYFKNEIRDIPRRAAIIRIVDGVHSLLFGRMFPMDNAPDITELYGLIREQIEHAYSFAGEDTALADEQAASIIDCLPKIKELLIKDAQAIYEGDPAARCPEEVMLCYPGFLAISIYRLAHEFYIRRIPFIGRLMTEYSHERTGVDIHAGAKIGEYFCIDHGTGIVIGETTVIGDRVKIYQGVTLGAKSFELGDDGNPVKGIKRHPNIGNGVVIYANATILGGNTYIGDGAVIGANVWVTSSVEPGTVVHYTKK